jgi:hypothetical protein
VTLTEVGRNVDPAVRGKLKVGAKVLIERFEKEDKFGNYVFGYYY